MPEQARGHEHGHGHGHGHGHDELTDEETALIAKAIWEQETVELLTVGVDIGSSTTHLLFAKVVMRRRSQSLSSAFVVVERTVVWRSPIIFTPFLPDGLIDADALRDFLKRSYAEAGLSPEQVDTGAVILTGEAIKRPNARAIDEIFASESGKFVCATAGHRLEATLAAYGSGAARLSAQAQACYLHVDIGGGTTKLALIDHGEVLGVAAFAIGGRLLARDDEGTWSRIDDSAHAVAAELGIDLDASSAAQLPVRLAIARRMATLVVDQIVDGAADELGRALELTEPLVRDRPPDGVTFSGGVSEYLVDGEAVDHGDIAQLLATQIKAQLAQRSTVPVVAIDHRIRATVIGASQFTVQVSGKTVYLSGGESLPVHNVPVVAPTLILDDPIDPAAITAAVKDAATRGDQSLDEVVALALSWHGPPSYERLHAVAAGIYEAMGGEARTSPLILVIDGDVGQSLGRLLHKELGLALPLVSLDGVALKQFDFVDVGEWLDPPGVVPVVIKSLLFG
jgi:ethanolamine utilization protein EutA